MKGVFRNSPSLLQVSGTQHVNHSPFLEACDHSAHINDN